MTDTDLFGQAEPTIKCISMWQPWAWWVMRGWKTIETRTHNRFKGLAGSGSDRVWKLQIDASRCVNSFRE